MIFCPGKEFSCLAVRLLSLSEACKRISCSRSYYYAKVVQHVPIRKLGSASRVRSDELETYICGLEKANFTQSGVAK